MSIIKQFIKNIGFTSLANGSIALKSLILLPIIVRTLGIADYGLWAQILVTIHLLIPIALSQFAMGFIRFNSASTDKKDISRHFTTLLIVIVVWSVILIFLIVIITRYLLVSFFDLSGVENYIILIGLIIMLMTINFIMQGYYLARLQIKRYAGFLIVQNITEVILITSFITIGWGIKGALMALVINVLYMNVVMLSIIYREVGFTSPDFSIISKYAAFSLPLVPLELFFWITDSSDKYLTGFFLGLSAVGIYAVVYNISRVVYMFAIPMNYVLSPTLVKKYETGKIDEVKVLLGFSIKLFLMFAVPIVIGLSVLAYPITWLMTGKEYSTQNLLLVPVLSSSILFYGIGSLGNHINNLMKKTHVSGAIWGMAAGLNIALNIVLIPMVGIMGAAVSTLITFVFATSCIISYTMKFIVIPVDWEFLLKSYFSAFIMGIILLFIGTYVPINIFTTAFLILLGMLIYFGVLFSVKAIGEKEKDFIRKLLDRNDR